MKKLIITMIAIAFSFSAYSEIYLIEKSESIGVWCVNTYVFVGHSGALVQLYSSFTYQGPYHVKKITLDLIALIQQEGYRNISEVIGQHS